MNMSSRQMCTRCKTRWRQDQGLCRRCARELGEIWQLRRLELQGQELRRDVRRRRTCTIDGEQYEVVFDGT